jgi:hypothetical protein
VLLIGGDRGQQSQRLLGPAARLSLIDGKHLPVGAGQVELVVVQFELPTWGCCMWWTPVPTWGLTS